MTGYDSPHTESVCPTTERGQPSALVSLLKTSLVDYPGKVAAVIFFPGCNLRCPWCHNRELVLEAPGKQEGLIPLEDAVSLIAKRAKVLGGVVLSGGEPLLQKNLGALIARIHALGLPVKLDTNGTFPDELEALLLSPDTSPDYLALDLKLAPGRYGEIGGGDCAKKLTRSASLLSCSGIPYEYRSLAFPGNTFTVCDIEALAPLVDPAGHWYFGTFRGGNCLDSRWDSYPDASDADALPLAQVAAALGKNATLRI